MASAQETSIDAAPPRPGAARTPAAAGVRLLGGVALQNLGRRRARTFLLMAAVAIGAAIVFGGATMMRSIEQSMAVGFTRMGADLMVVPERALTNITAALLTVEPTDETLDIHALDGVGIAGIKRIAPQRIYRADHSGIGGEHGTVDIIGFDPERDFTVMPWLDSRLPGAMQPGDVIVGARRDLLVGSEVLLFGRPMRVYGKLAPTGVGTHELGIFMPFSTLNALVPAICGDDLPPPPMLTPDNVSGFLVELAPGATELSVQFALMSNVAGIKVVAGDSMLSSIRQGLSTLMNGTLALVGMMFASTALMVGVLFSAIIAERHAELGLLKAIGAKRRQIVALLLMEAVVATGVGGVAGVGLGLLVLRAFERSLVYRLEEIGIPFVWLSTPAIVLSALGCILLASVTGAVGALYPAWRASRRDAYDLIRGAA